MDVTLERINRTVVARGPGGGPITDPVRGWLEDKLTYFERHYDFAAGDGGGGFSLVPRPLYYLDPRTGHLLFPYGLRPRVANELRAAGHAVRYAGRLLIDEFAKANTPDWDGLFAEFQIFPGQDDCLKRIAASDGGIVHANTGWGKAQPLDSAVYTPQGPKRMGDVRVGDVVCHPYSGVSTVVAVHPQGVIPVYRVEFADGAVVRCCGNHLWRVRRRGSKTKYQVVTTDSLRTRMAQSAGADAYMTAASPLAYDARSVDIPPYTLGVLLGDGSLTQSTVKWSKPDPEIVTHVAAELPPGLVISGSDAEHTIVGDGVVLGGKGNYDRCGDDWHPYRAALKRYGLWGSRSEEKFIPEVYLRNSVETRMELLRGLMDTDGSVFSSGLAVEYSTSSPRLAEDFRELAASLGIDVSVTRRQTTHLDSYRIKVKAPDPSTIFKSSAKRSKVTPRTKYQEVVRKIRAIVPDGQAESQCITVSAADGLYVTDGCVPTHNSVVLRMLCRLYPQARIHVTTKSRTLAQEIFSELQQTEPTVGFVGDGKKRFARVTMIMADSLHHGMGDADILIADECFTGDTPVLTPHGGVRIDEVKPGDLVYCASGLGIVEGVHVKPGDNLHKVEFDDGTSFVCTGDHPIFTDHGWREAATVVGRSAYGPEAVRRLWEGDDPVGGCGRQERARGLSIPRRVGPAAELLQVLCEEIVESDAAAGGSTQSQRNSPADRSHAPFSRRERAIAAFASLGTPPRVGGRVGGGVRGADAGQGGVGVSVVVQNRHRQLGDAGGSRDRRGEPQHPNQAGPGREEDRVPGVARVVRVTRVERAGVTPVYNLRVGGHPSYFAAGKLVHNCHELVAPKYADKLGMYQRARMFGLSATPTGRSDNRDVVGEAIFGPVLYTIDYQAAEAMGRVVPISVEWLRIPTGPQTGHYRMQHLRERYGVWRNDTRNDLIAARARQFGPDEQVLIMVKTIEHAVHLKSRLPDFTLAYAKDGMDEDRISGYIDQGLLPADEPVMTGDRVERLRTEFAAGTLKKVIANYVWSTGVNFRTLAVMIRADAAASEIRDGQIPGRICRRVAGVKEAALLVDCWDEWDRGLKARSGKRKANYAKRGWTQSFATLPVKKGGI